LFNPERARLLADAGISKVKTKEMLYQYSLLPASYFRKGDLAKLEEKGRLVGDKVSLVDSPDDIAIAVMGGTGIHTVFLPGFSHEIIPHVPVSKTIDSQ
jgi:hypothetical protein